MSLEGGTWHDGSVTHPASSRLSSGAPVVVVGAGVVGLCVAEALLREGLPVVVVERGSATRDGASFGNAGLIVPSHVVPLAAPGVLGQGLRWLLDRESPFYVQPRLDVDLVRWGLAFLRASTAQRVARAAPVLRDLNLASRALHLELAQRLPGASSPVQAGLLVVCLSEAGLREEGHGAERAAELGLRVERVSGDEVAARLPGLREGAAGGVHYLDDAHASPRALMAALEQAVGEGGGSIRHGAEAIGFEREGKRVTGVRLRGGETLPASAVVLAGGVATTRLAQELGVRLPMQAGRGYSVTVRDAPLRLSVPAILAEARVAVTPLPEGLRLGGTMEIAAVDRAVDPRRVRGILRSAERYFPALDADTLAAEPVWSGARPVSPDGLPYLGPLTAVENVVVAAGHAMMGFSLAPVTGRIVADGLLGRTPMVASPLLDPERYTARGRR
jgi:D-amino-acid dehydrogenase